MPARKAAVQEQINVDRIVAALQDVPEARLKIIDLARELAVPGGTMDYRKISARMPEINLAVAEARAYSRATKDADGAITALVTATPRSQIETEYDDDDEE